MDCYLVEVASKKVKFSFSGPTKDAYYAEISPQESYLASSPIFNRKIVLWSIETGEVVIELPGHDTCTRGLTFSPDEKRLASLSIQGEVCVWNIAEQTLIMRQDIPLEEFKSFEFENNNQLSIQLQDKLIQLDVSSEQKVTSAAEQKTGVSKHIMVWGTHARKEHKQKRLIKDCNHNSESVSATFKSARD